jgi:hypothetical protein
MNVCVVLDSGVDTATDILTLDSGSVPSTGGMLRYTVAGSGAIGGLKLYHDYYVIKLSSSTFKLAETYEEAIAGASIDITSVGSTTNRFLSFEIVDFNAVDIDWAGAITGVNTYKDWSDHVIFGAEVLDYDSSSTFNHYLVTVPNVENRGYIVTPKIFAQGNTDTFQRFVVRFKPLTASDVIVVKEKSRDIFELPTTTQRATGGVSWIGSDAFTTTADIESVYNAFNAGHAIEVEVLADASAGAMEQISAIDYDSGTYTVTLKHDVPYASGGKVSEVQFDNWKVVATINSTSAANSEGVVSVPIGVSSKWSMYKVELRGVYTTIEDVSVVSVPHKQAL